MIVGEKILVEYRYDFVPAKDEEPAWWLIPKNQLYKTSDWTLECPNKFRCRSDVYSVANIRKRNYNTKKNYNPRPTWEEREVDDSFY